MPLRNPLVSVVIPSYNCGGVIGDTLESVLAQDYPALEVIVVDDGSTDDTCDVVARYGDRVTLLQQRNAGAAVARNAGIRCARGDYVALLDADDLWLPGKLSIQVDHLEGNPQVGTCCTRWHLQRPDEPKLCTPPALVEPVQVDPTARGGSTPDCCGAARYGPVRW